MIYLILYTLYCILLLCILYKFGVSAIADWLSHVTTRKLAAAQHPNVKFLVHLIFSRCAVTMQSSKIHGRPAEEAIPVKASHASPKKSHDPWVHLLAGA